MLRTLRSKYERYGFHKITPEFKPPPHLSKPPKLDVLTKYRPPLTFFPLFFRLFRGHYSTRITSDTLHAALYHFSEVNNEGNYPTSKGVNSATRSNFLIYEQGLSTKNSSRGSPETQVSCTEPRYLGIMGHISD